MVDANIPDDWDIDTDTLLVLCVDWLKYRDRNASSSILII